MLLSLIPGMSIPAFAAEAITLTAETTTWENGDYVVPAGGLTISGHITVNGTVNLTLTEGTTLTANAGITLSDGATLNVSGEGAMTVNGTNNSTASTVAGNGTLVLTSGTLTAKGGNGQGIGDRKSNQTGANGGTAINGSVIMNGGTLTATGGNGGSVGGSCYNCKGGNGDAAISGNLTVNGGTMTATNGTAGSLGSRPINSSAGAAGASIGGTLTLGKNVTLYDGLYNVLDDNNSSSREYKGDRTQIMHAVYEVTYAVTQITHTPAAAEGTVSMTYGDSSSTLLPGETSLDDVKGKTVTLNITPGSGYRVKSVTVEKPAEATITLDNTTTGWRDGTYTVPAGGLTYSDAITVSGDVTLVLTDGETLTLNKGIGIAEGATLTIQGEGTMNVNGTNSSTASTVAGCTGTLVLTSGTLTAKGGDGQGFSSFGDNRNGAVGGVAINGNVTVEGGTLTATGGNGGSIGSDAGPDNRGGNGGAAISGSLTINGGTVTTTNGSNGTSSTQSWENSSAGSGGKAVAGTVTDNTGTNTETGGAGNESNPEETAAIIEAEKQTDGSWQFTMPDYSVTLNIEYEDHIHNFTYSADGDTITATCGAEDKETKCSLKDKNYQAKLTIAPSSTGGTAEITGDTGEFPFDTNSIQITYQKKGSSGWEDSAAPSNNDTGFYCASFTLGGATASVTYGVSVITKGTGDGNGCSFDVPKVAGVGAKIEPTLTLAKGYEVKKITVKGENGNDVSDAVHADKTGFTMPDYNITVDVAFGMIDYTITKNTMANGSVTVKNASEEVITKAHYDDVITLDVAPADHFTLKSLTVKDSSNKNVAVTGEGDTRTFTMPASDVTVSAEFEGNPFGITTEVSPANGGTVAIGGTGVVTANNVTTAKAGSTVTLTVEVGTGFTLGSVTVKKANGGTVTVENNTFTMPAEAVTVSATFAGKETTATLAVTGNEGTTCTAKLLNSAYEEIESVTKKGGEPFILLVNRDEGYDFTVTYGTANSPVTLTEFTEDEYKAYVDYAKDNNLAVSSSMVLAWAMMPGVEGGNVTLTANFAKLKTFTVLYQPTDNPDNVWCKFAKTEGGNTVTASSQMKSDATMGDGSQVYSLKVTAAFNPEKVAFVTDESNLESATMGNATVSLDTNSWNNITGGKYLVIGGNAKTVVAAFVTDENAIPFYNSGRGKKPEHPGTGVTYRLAVCLMDENGNVTTPGTVTAPAAPKPSEKGTVFAGWSALVGTAPNKAEIKCAAGATAQITENTSFNATWEPIQLTVTLNLNGGQGVSGAQTVTYGNTLPTMAPTKDSFAFDGWTVDKTVIEGRYLYLKGSTFIPDTQITSNMGLTADWKHVHTYTCYRLEEVGLQWFYDDNAVHVAFCSCYDYKMMAHEYDSDGMCACGKHKPEAGKVQLDVSYVQFINGKYETKFKDKTRMEPQGKYVTLSASNLWGSDWSFSKWQYSTDEGNTWKDLAVTTSVKFGVMCNMRVRAVYEESADVKPQVELNASKYDDHFEYNGTSLPMDNIAFEMSYKLPANCTFVDAGLRFGDNDGIGYYDIKERTVELSAGQNAANWIGGFATSLLTFSTPEWTDSSYTERYYELRKNNALDEMSATELAKCIYEGKTTKAKVDPIYWDSKVKTEGNRGAISTRAPLNMTNAEDKNNWIYGIAWMRYKDADGQLHTIYTDALATTLNGILKDGTKSVTKTAAN